MAITVVMSVQRDFSDYLSIPNADGWLFQPNLPRYKIQEKEHIGLLAVKLDLRWLRMGIGNKPAPAMSRPTRCRMSIWTTAIGRSSTGTMSTTRMTTGGRRPAVVSKIIKASSFGRLYRC